MTDPVTPPVPAPGPILPAAPPNTPPPVEPPAATVEPPVEAPASAPPEPPVEPPVPPVEPPADAPLDTAVWGSTGDPVGDSVLSLLQNAGATPEQAKALMYDALAAGDVSKVDKAALTALVGKDRAELVLAGSETFVARSTEKAAAVLATVHTAVGGKENWAAIAAWAKTGVPEASLAEYRSMVDAGGAQARFAAAELAAAYNADAKNTTLSAPALEIIPSGPAPSTAMKTTRAQYVAALSAAHRNGKATPAELAAIQHARERGRAAGI